MNSKINRALQVTLLILGTLATTGAVRHYAFKTVVVDGVSMFPNLRPGETYLLKADRTTIARGDIVVIRDGLGGEAVKRVIGLPGETVKIDGYVWINFRKLQEDYLKKDLRTFQLQRRIFSLGPDEYFVLGDNRNNSTDSRAYGPVKAKAIDGLLCYASR